MMPVGIRNLLVAFCLMILVSPIHFSSGSRSYSTKQCHVNIDSEEFADGDIILRNGIGIISEFFASFSLKDRSFSHAGILLSSDSGWVVFHALGGESAGAGGILVDKLSDFCSVNVTDSVKVFRLTEDKSVRKSVKSFCIRKAGEKVVFDRRFSLDDTTAMYCTEFVYQAFKSAGSGAISLPLTRFNGIEYVSCDNLYINEHARPLAY